jgi:hypothetical protein
LHSGRNFDRFNCGPTLGSLKHQNQKWMCTGVQERGSRLEVVSECEPPLCANLGTATATGVSISRAIQYKHRRSRKVPVVSLSDPVVAVMGGVTDQFANEYNREF